MIGLIIEDCKPEDAGKYTVTVSNKLGEAADGAEAEVQEKEKMPSFFGEMQPVRVVEGFPAKLEIKCLGNPRPVIKWLHFYLFMKYIDILFITYFLFLFLRTHNGNEVVPDGKHIKITTSPDGTCCLVIDKARPEDAGEYEVIATNSLGSVASQGVLDVAGTYLN